MASLPYPLNRLVYSYCQSGCHTHSIGLCTHVVNLIAIPTQSACVLMYVWVWQGCHTLLQIPVLLSFPQKTCSSVLLFSPINLFSCSLVFPQKPVLMFFCLSNKPVLMFSCLFPKKPVLMFFCLSIKTCSHVLLSFPKTTTFSLHPCLYVAKKNGWEQRSQPLSLELCLLLSKADSLLRTYACACTALCAEIRVDRILFAF